MDPDKDETTELKCCADNQVGKTAGVIMAAVLLEGGVKYLTPAIAAKCREAALIAHAAEEDKPGSE